MSSHTALPIEPLDVLIIGAGVSGIGAAAYLRRHQPHKVFAILESRERMGGTWDLFRYPGIRSDSDLYTFGFDFKPWTKAKSLADAADILEYLREAVAEYQFASRTATRQKPAPSNAAGCSAQAATTVMTKASAHASRARSSSRGKSSTRNTGPSAWTIGASMWWSSAAAQRR